MANTIGWGQAAVNNTIDWGKGKTNNTIDWGEIYDLSPSGETNIVGAASPFTIDSTKEKVDSTLYTSDKTIY
jgi:hypothetical protein